jgi:hypothetical protein
VTLQFQKMTSEPSILNSRKQVGRQGDIPRINLGPTIGLLGALGKYLSAGRQRLETSPASVGIGSPVTPNAASSLTSELRQHCRARYRGRIPVDKDNGLRNRPLHRFVQNQVWRELSAIASELLLGCRASPSADTPAPGNPNGCVCACSPGRRLARADRRASARPGLGPVSSASRSPAGLLARLTSTERHCD